MISILNQFTALLAEGEQMLLSSGSPTPELDAQLLLAHVLGMDRMKMLVDPPDSLPVFASDAYRRILARRHAGEPVFYITGSKEFHNYVFNVNPAVLIPRPETEELVEAVLKRFPNEQLAVADVGTGSGCIAITLGLERPAWRVCALDVSEKALETARENAEILNAANVEFFHSDLLAGVEGLFDVIVSNPPYIDFAKSGSLQVEIRKYEPALALYAEEKGMKIIKELAAQSATRLKPGGAFFCEIGYDQKNAVERIFDENIWESVSFIKDISGHHRIAAAVLKGDNEI
jgi:release factor glutamine methyltransferase